MKERVKQARKAILGTLLLCMLTILAIPGIPGKAATKPVCPKTQTVYIDQWNMLWGKDYEETMYGVTNFSSYIYIQNLSANAKITGLKSSDPQFQVTAPDPKAIKAVAISYTNDYQSVKSGRTTKVSFKVKQNGKTYALSCKVTFRPAKAPFKSFKIGKTNYASKFKNNVYGYAKKFTSRQKIQIQPAAGFKVKKIVLEYKTKSKTVKNGATVSLKDVKNINVIYECVKKPQYYQKSNYAVMSVKPSEREVALFLSPTLA